MRAAQLLTPGFGGSTRMRPSLPDSTALIEKLPLGVFLIWALLTGPFSPLASLYLNPLTALPLQNVLPVMLLTPCGRGNTCADGVPPLAEMLSEAPETVGSPTMVFVLAFSFAFTSALRLSGVLGFLS